MKHILSLILMICGAFTSAAYAQDRLVTHSFISGKVTEGYFQKKPGVTIPLDDYCINATEAKAWLYLVENMLPAEPNRMPLWSELVPVPKVTPCNEISDPACQADYESYGACGSWLYQLGFDAHFNSFSRQRLGGTTNPLWNPSAALGAEYCSSPPPTQQSGMAVQSVASSNVDSVSITNSVSAMTTSVWSGALNRCGVWQCNNTVGTSVWMSVSGTFTAPVQKIYYIGVAADNLFELYIDGMLIAAMNDPVNAPEESFLLWHILPVDLDPGTHTIELKARNTQSGPASLGCEVYNNSVAELENASNESDLKLLFTSEVYRGGNICRSPNKINFHNNTIGDNVTATYGGISHQILPGGSEQFSYSSLNSLTMYASAFFDLYVDVIVDDVYYTTVLGGRGSTPIPLPASFNKKIDVIVY